jgi:DNA-binding GntR family transcriptional regulator
LATFTTLDAQNRLRDLAAGAIRSAIVNGELRAGEQVNQAQVAEQFGISRGSVREALAALVDEGFIDNIPYKGTYVKEVNPTLIRELYDIRRVLEPFAVDRMIALDCPRARAALRSKLNLFEACEPGGDRAQAVQHDLDFHRLIVEGAQQSVLLGLWRSVEAGIRLCLAQGHRLDKTPAERLVEHSAIYTAIVNQDVSKAQALLITHLHDAESYILASHSA